jgi:hypothetical protein
VLEPETSHSSQSEEEEAELPLELGPNPDRGFRRLVLSILLQSVEDYVGAQDLQTHNAAKWFLFPTSVDRQEHLHLLIANAGLDVNWFTGKLEKLRLKIVPPEGKVTLNRFAVKRRARQGCGSASNAPGFDLSVSGAL